MAGGTSSTKLNKVAAVVVLALIVVAILYFAPHAYVSHAIAYILVVVSAAQAIHTIYRIDRHEASAVKTNEDISSLQALTKKKDNEIKRLKGFLRQQGMTLAQNDIEPFGKYNPKELAQKMELLGLNTDFDSWPGHNTDFDKVARLGRLSERRNTT